MTRPVNSDRMSQRNRRAGLALGTLLLAPWLPGALSGQSSDSYLWLSAGLGLAGGSQIEAGLVGNAQLNFHKPPHHTMIRVSLAADVASRLDSSGGAALVELGLLYGRGSGGENGYQSVAAGLALVTLSECAPTSNDSCVTVGIPVVAELDLTATVLGVGIQAFGNLNIEAPLAGLAFTLGLGWLP